MDNIFFVFVSLVAIQYIGLLKIGSAHKDMQMVVICAVASILLFVSGFVPDEPGTAVVLVVFVLGMIGPAALYVLGQRVGSINTLTGRKKGD